MEIETYTNTSRINKREECGSKVIMCPLFVYISKQLLATLTERENAEVTILGPHI